MRSISFAFLLIFAAADANAQCGSGSCGGSGLGLGLRRNMVRYQPAEMYLPQTVYFQQPAGVQPLAAPVPPSVPQTTQTEVYAMLNMIRQDLAEMKRDIAELKSDVAMLKAAAKR